MEDVEKSPPVVVGVTDAKHIARRINVVRQQAGIEYITDPDGKSIRWHYDRPDRDYGEHVTWMTFDQWARTDKWVDRRVKFWQDIEARTLRLYRDELLKARLEEIREMTESRSFIFEHLQPLRNADGTVQRDDQDSKSRQVDQRVHQARHAGHAQTRRSDLSDRNDWRRGEAHDDRSRSGCRDGFAWTRRLTNDG